MVHSRNRYLPASTAVPAKFEPEVLLLNFRGQGILKVVGGRQIEMTRLNAKFRSSEDLMRHDDRISYLMLFCALMMVRNAHATVEQSLEVVPLRGAAKRLAGEIVNQS